jgi:hypothetical protein
MSKSKSEKKGTKNEKPEKEKAHKPKQAVGAYFFFSNEFVPKLKEKEEISHKDAVAKAGQEWNTMSAKEKEPY